MAQVSVAPPVGLVIEEQRTLRRRSGRVSVLVPAHNEAPTIAEVVTEARRGLALLGVAGEVVVSASGCTDDTASLARSAGARVVEAPVGKGAAIAAAFPELDGDIVCLVDGDVRYFGRTPLVALLVGPIVDGLADACVSDLYWRPVYPDMWMHGLLVPLASAVLPELLTRCGSTPWSGQRAALRRLFPTSLPDGYTVDLTLLLHWNQHADRLRPVLADDWTHPQRPKPELLAQDFEVLIEHAVGNGRLHPGDVPAVAAWFDVVHAYMTRYGPGDDPVQFERALLRTSSTELRRHLGQVRPGDGRR